MLRSQLVRTDLSGCLMPNCHLCNCSEGGGSHTRIGCVYSGKCLLCEKEGKKVVYYGESRHNGYQRVGEHRVSILSDDHKNAFTKHLQLQHPDRVKDPNVFAFKVEGTYRSCLDRQVREGGMITYGDVDEKMNSKAEFHQPGVTRIVTTREVGR